MIRYCRYYYCCSLHRGCHTFFFFLAVHFTQKNTILLRFVRCCTMAVIGKWIHQTCCCERVLTYQILHVLTYAFQALPSAPSTSSHTVRYECAERCVQKRFNLGQWTVEPHFHIIMCVFPRHWPRMRSLQRVLPACSGPLAPPRTKWTTVVRRHLPAPPAPPLALQLFVHSVSPRRLPHQLHLICRLSVAVIVLCLPQFLRARPFSICRRGR